MDDRTAGATGQEHLVSSPKDFVLPCCLFDALTMKRPYKAVWELDKVFQLLTSEKGKHFEPKLVDAFLENKDKMLAIKERWDDKNTLT